MLRKTKFKLLYLYRLSKLTISVHALIFVSSPAPAPAPVYPVIDISKEEPDEPQPLTVEARQELER